MYHGQDPGGTQSGVNWDLSLRRKKLSLKTKIYERERTSAFVDSLHRPICECVLLSGICSQFHIFPPAPILVFLGLIIDGYGNLTPIGTLGNRTNWRI